MAENKRFPGKELDASTFTEKFDAANKAAKASNIKDEPKAVKYIVTQPFRSIENFNELYNAGDDVSHFTPERLEGLITIGLVKKD